MNANGAHKCVFGYRYGISARSTLYSKTSQHQDYIPINNSHRLKLKGKTTDVPEFQQN